MLEPKGHYLKSNRIPIGAWVIAKSDVGMLPWPIFVVVSDVLQTVLQFVRAVRLVAGVQLVYQDVSGPDGSLGKIL